MLKSFDLLGYVFAMLAVIASGLTSRMSGFILRAMLITGAQVTRGLNRILNNIPLSSCGEFALLRDHFQTGCRPSPCPIDHHYLPILQNHSPSLLPIAPSRVWLPTSKP
jgi:hypothetical protein